MTAGRRQEALCKAYVQAVAARAGLLCSRPEPDYGIDLSLRTVEVSDHRYADTSVQLDLQLKSTTRADVTDSAVKYDRVAVPLGNVFSAPGVQALMERVKQRREL